MSADAAPVPLVPVSWGELVDKLTILEIKLARIADADALANVAHEHAVLRVAATPLLADKAAWTRWFAALHAVNADLWDIEDAVRRHEAAGDFGTGFVALARAVYRRNDERAAIKRQINLALGSRLIEEKCYASAAHEVERDEPGARIA